MNKIVKNSLFNIVRSIIIVPIYFFIVPYTISHIGKSGYGIWALTGIVANYQVFIDFGLSKALIRFVALEEAKKDYRAISEYLATSLVVFLFFSIIIYLGIVSFSRIIAINILGIKSNLEIVIFLILFAGLSSVVNMVSGLFQSIIDGVQRMDVSNIIMTFQVIISAIGTFIVLERGFGLKGLAANLLFISISILIMNIFFSKKLLPFLRINLLLFRFQRFKKMFAYSINLQFSSLIRMWAEPISKIFISHLFSINYVGYYEIALRFINNLTRLIRAAISPLFPAAAEIYHKFGIWKVEELQEKSIKYLLIFSMGVYIFIILIIPNFIKLWLGAEFVIVSVVIQIFLIGSFISILATPSYTILNGLGFSKDTFFIMTQVVLINIIGSVVLGYLIGFIGFCVGTSISLIYSFFVTHHFYRKRISKRSSLLNLFFQKRFIIAGFILILVGIVFINIISMNNYLRLIILGLFLMILYVVILWRLKIFNKNDIKEIIGEKVYNQLLLKMTKINK